jgi:cathepsin F
MYLKKLILFISLFIFCINQENNTTEFNAQDSKKAYLQDEMDMYKSFSDFMQTFNKTYSIIAEMNARYQVFKDNVKKSLQENSTSELYDSGITPFSDLTDQEFQQTFTNLKISLNDVIEAQSLVVEDETEGRHLQTLPSSLDWRLKGAVTEIDQQGSCASCWSFGIVANLEGQYYLKYGYLIRFSEQYLLNCNSYGYGCEGGFFANVYKWLMTTDGLRRLSDMPYLGYKTRCSVSNIPAVVRVSGYTHISDDEDTIMYELNRRGPLLAAINANRLRYYTRGILASTDDICDPYNLNHAVLLVGYGTTSMGTPFWIVKNTYGPYWGENGYFRILRGSGTCGINRLVMTGFLA